MSLKAGGVGLNLTAASIVYLMVMLSISDLKVRLERRSVF